MIKSYITYLTIVKEHEQCKYKWISNVEVLYYRTNGCHKDQDGNDLSELQPLVLTKPDTDTDFHYKENK
jgi:hypothetical protein